MTQQDDITQRVLTDDEIEALAKKHIAPHADRLDAILPTRVPYQQTEQFRRVKGLIVDVLSKLRAPVSSIREGFELTYAADADDPACATDLFHFTNGWRACVMSQVRAPVADERAAFVAWLTGSYPDVYSEPEAMRLWHHEHVAALAWEERARRAALASAPVAGEVQQPVAHWIPSAKTFSTARVSPGKAWEPLYAAPQASAENVTRDLVGLVVKLGRSIRKSDPAMYGMALDFLKRHNLQGSPLRGESTTPPTGPTQAQCKAAAEIARGFGARHLADVLDPPQADKDGGQQRAGDVDERAAFEASGITQRLYRSTEPGYTDEYQDSHTQFAWRGWKARAALSAAQAEQGERDA